MLNLRHSSFRNYFLFLWKGKQWYAQIILIILCVSILFDCFSLNLLQLYQLTAVKCKEASLCKVYQCVNVVLYNVMFNECIMRLFSVQKYLHWPEHVKKRGEGDGGFSDNGVAVGGGRWQEDPGWLQEGLPCVSLTLGLYSSWYPTGTYSTLHGRWLTLTSTEYRNPRDMYN